MERPKEIIYWMDERPPLHKCILLGLQHSVVICPYLVLVALVVEAAGVPTLHAAQYIGVAMLAVVLHAILQCHRIGPVGSGYLAPPIVSAIYLPAALSAAHAGGLPLVAGMVLFAAVCEMVLSRLVTRLRKVFPSVVSGIILMSVGIELTKISLGIAFDQSLVDTPRFGPQEFVFAVTILIMVCLSIWGRGPLKLFCALVGILIGYGVTLALNQAPAVMLTDFAQAPAFTLPLAWPGGLDFRWEYVVPFALAGIASGLRTVGVLTTCQQMNDAAWTKSDTQSLRGGVLADGLGCAIGGVFGVPGLSASPSLVGIERATGATSRSIVWALAACMVLLACLPKFATLIVHMPKPVMGAALLFNGSFMFVGGMQIAFRRPVAIRETFIIGLSVLLALGTVIYPSFFHALPAWSHPITESPIAIATCTAVLLNLMCLLGRKRGGSLDVRISDQPTTHRQLVTFLNARIQEWKLPAADADRIRHTVEDLIDQIVSANANESTIDLSVTYDDFDVCVSLCYTGSLVQTRSVRTVKEPVEEQAFISGLSGYLADVNADTVRPTLRDGHCRIDLSFRI